MPSHFAKKQNSDLIFSKFLISILVEKTEIQLQRQPMILTWFPFNTKQNWQPE
jgi:hypothetical protein